MTADLVEGGRLAPAQAVPHHDDLPLPVVEPIEDVAEVLQIELRGDQLERSGGLGVLDEVAQGGVVLADRLEDGDRLGAIFRASRIFSTVIPDSSRSRRRRAVRTLQQVRLGGLQLGDGVHHVDGHSDGAGLVGDGPGDRLPDPPGGVGGELKPCDTRTSLPHG